MEFHIARQNMIENQIKPSGVTDNSIINAMADLPREKFVSSDAATVCYSDKEIFLGDERYMMAPTLLASLLQEARIAEEHLVLNIGCGSGYSVAVLSRICRAVVGIEENPTLFEKASSLMVELGIDNALIVKKPLVNGYSKQAPYDAIVFNGAIEELPKKIIGQLANGGCIASVMRVNSNLGKAVITRKFGKLITATEIFDAWTPYMPQFNKKSSFKF